MKLEAMSNHRSVIRFSDESGQAIIRVNEKNYQHSVWFYEEKTTDWEIDKKDALEINHFDQIIDHEPELILIGHALFSQNTTVLSHSQSTQMGLMKLGIHSEIMSLYGACQTWNVLQSDHRKLVLALIL